jgi:hypothetical protein
LQIAVNAFLGLVRWNRQSLLPTTRALLAALAEDPLTVSLRLPVIVQGLPWEEVGPELSRLVDALHADALVVAEQAIQDATTRPDAELLALETLLAGSTSELLRRLALSALQARTRQARGWSDECIAHLENYRRDPSPLVAEAAQFTFVS